MSSTAIFIFMVGVAYAMFRVAKWTGRILKNARKANEKAQQIIKDHGKSNETTDS